MMRENDVDDAVKSTADDAALAKLSCVDMGYYDDPHLRPMSIGAMGRDAGGGGWDRGGGSGGMGGDNDDDFEPRRRNQRSINSRLRHHDDDDHHHRHHDDNNHHQHHHNHRHNRRCGGEPSGTEPMIRRGTHARAMAMERAIDAFLWLDIPPSSSSSPRGEEDGEEEEGRHGPGRCSRKRRQIVILGSGRDTAYLRHRFGRKKKKEEGGDDDDTGHENDDVRWFEVDHPSMIEQKAHIWLPRCVPNGHDYVCITRKHKRDENVKGSDGDLSYSIVISPREAPLPSSSDYHLVGHDLRTSPESLFQKLSHPEHGYDESSPTLFVLECVLMYLPEPSVSDLLSRIAASPTSSTSRSSFVAVAIYDPIPGHDRFGRLMIENLKRAGVLSSGGGGRKGGDDKHKHDNQNPGLMSLEKTRTLMDQLTRLVRTCGFDVSVGCDMVDAYDHGVILSEDRERAMRCEALDELEEFTLMMRHYCLLMGVATSSTRGASIRVDEDNSIGCEPASSDCDGNCGSDVGIRLCSVGANSPMGFRDGRCTVLKKAIYPMRGPAGGVDICLHAEH